MRGGGLLAFAALWLAAPARAQNAFEFRRASDNAVIATLGQSGVLTVSTLAVSGSSLTVVDTSAGDSYSLAVTTASNGSVYHLYVATTGKVGLGNSAPASTLEVAQDIRSTVEPLNRMGTDSRSSTTIINTAAETTFSGTTYTIPANSADTEWIYRWEGQIDNYTGSTQTYTVKFYFDATAASVSISLHDQCEWAAGPSGCPETVYCRVWLVQRDASSAQGNFFCNGSSRSGYPEPSIAEIVFTGINWGTSHTLKMTMTMPVASTKLDWQDGMTDLDTR